MINKELLKNRFSKGLKSYNKNAMVQDKLARDLTILLTQNCSNFFGKVLEIGTGTGLLTKHLNANIKFHAYFANDIIAESEDYVQDYVPKARFIHGDIEAVQIPRHFDLIASSASIHWVNNFEEFVEKMHTSLIKGGIFAFTTFLDKNFTEIKDILGVSLNYLTFEELQRVCNQKFEIIYLEEEIVQLKFDTPKDILKHIKLTGTNALIDWKWTKSKLADYEKQYTEKYQTPQGIRLTYNPAFVILKKVV